MEKLWQACKEGNLDELNRMLKIPENVEYIDVCENLAYEIALKHKHFNIIVRLLEFPAVVRYMANNLSLQFFLSKCYENYDIMSHLLEFREVRERMYLIYGIDDPYAKLKRKEMYRRHMKVFYRHIFWKIFCIHVDKFRYRPQFVKVIGLLKATAENFTKNIAESSSSSSSSKN